MKNSYGKIVLREIQRLKTSTYFHPNLVMGMSNMSSIGINNRKGQWAYSRTAYSSEIKQIKDFLDKHKGADSFLWKAPLDGEVRVKSDVNYKLTNIGGDVWQISTTFTQVFYP